MNDKRVVIDTNLLLDDPSIITRYNCVILSHVFRELEKHKLSPYGELAFNARQATRFMEQNLGEISFDFKDYNVQFDKEFDANYTDNKIIQACLDNGYSLATRDLLLKHKAKAYNIDIVSFEIENTEEYTGFKEIEASDQELADLQEKSHINSFDLKVNQYLIATHPFGKADSTIFKWDGKNHELIKHREFNSSMLNKFKALDAYQRCAMDSVTENQITMIRGKAGSGKTQIAMSYAFDALEKRHIDKIIMFTGNTTVAGVQGIGFLPGTREEKLAESGIGTILSGKMGSRDHIYSLILEGKLDLLPISDLRGYDTGSNSLIILTEAQNTNKDIMKLCLQRVGEGSKVIIDGDDKTQVDKAMFAGSNNGMKAVSEVFRGEDIYGEVTLQTVRRSKIAEIADRI